MQCGRVVELELICWELPFHGRRGSFCSWKRPHIGPIRPKDQPSYLSLAVLLGEWWVGEENLLMWNKSEWPSLETRQSWVLKLSKSYKTNLMTPMLFWGTFLKPLWLCLCWVIPIFLCCVWVNSEFFAWVEHLAQSSCTWLLSEHHQPGCSSFPFKLWCIWWPLSEKLSSCCSCSTPCPLKVQDDT